MKIRPVGAESFHAHGQTDTTKLIVAVLQFCDSDYRCVALYFSYTLRPQSVALSEGNGEVCLYPNQLATNLSDGVVQNCVILHSCSVRTLC
jgi:hypothetical protein